MKSEPVRFRFPHQIYIFLNITVLNQPQASICVSTTGTAHTLLLQTLGNWVNVWKQTWSRNVTRGGHKPWSPKGAPGVPGFSPQALQEGGQTWDMPASLRWGGTEDWGTGIVGIGEDGTTNGMSSRCPPKRDMPGETENSQCTDRDGRQPPPSTGETQWALGASTEGASQS